MPRRARIARLKLGDFKIDVYDQETLLKLLEILGKEADRECKAVKGDEKHKLYIVDKANKAHKDDSFPESSEPSNGIPSYIEGNPWLKVLSRRG
ncbi:MAG: hypothetical protein ACTSXC_07455 [Candidatus Freyarchaeota archaeon]